MNVHSELTFDNRGDSSLKLLLQMLFCELPQLEIADAN